MCAANHATDRLHPIYLMHKNTNSSSQWYQRMKSLQGTLDGQRRRGGRRRGEKKEKDKMILVRLKANRKALIQNTTKRFEVFRGVLEVNVSVEVLAEGSSCCTVSTATLCGVSVVEQLGLTVGQDLDLGRIWTLTDPRRHESVQILQTCHLPFKRDETDEKSESVLSERDTTHKCGAAQKGNTQSTSTVKV